MYINEWINEQWNGRMRGRYIKSWSLFRSGWKSSTRIFSSTSGEDLVQKHAKGRSSHSDIKTTIKNVYKTVFVQNYHTKIANSKSSCVLNMHGNKHDVQYLKKVQRSCNFMFFESTLSLNLHKSLSFPSKHTEIFLEYMCASYPLPSL